MDVTIGERIGRLAAARPEDPAVIALAPDGREDTLSWAAFEAESNRVARALAAVGVPTSAVVAVILPAGLDHVVVTLGAWKLGTVVLPLDPEAPDPETVRLLDLARPCLVVANRPVPAPVPVVDPAGLRRSTVDTAALPRPERAPRSAHATGGSTGRPRIVLREPAWVYPDDSLVPGGRGPVAMPAGTVQLAMLPMHHAGFTKLHHGLALDQTVVLLTRFVPGLVPDLIERHRVGYFAVTPTMMRRLLREPRLREVDLSSVQTVHQSSAGCPPELKRAWFEVFPPHTLYEGYSSQERIGAVWIRGDEWLDHEGSVGRPVDCQVRIVTDAGRDAGPGEVGEIFLRSSVTRQPTYLGEGPLLPERDGFLSLGDCGYVDEDGYLYVVGRQSEMINVGGVKVYPPEVEAVLVRHPGVADSAVVRRSNAYLGEAVHALVVPADRDNPPDVGELRLHVLAELSPAKAPLSYEIVDRIPRDSADKLRRAELSPDRRRR